MFLSTGSHFSLSTNVVFTFASSVTLLVSMIGNSLVIYIVIKNQTMRTSTNCLIVSLGICDVLITMIQAPLLIVNLYSGDEACVSYLGNLTSKIFMLGVSISFYSSILSMVAIAIDRFLAVTRPLTYKVSSKRLVNAGIPLVWLSSCLLSSEMAMQGGKDEAPARTISLFAMYSWLVFLVISLITLTVLYSAICYRPWRRSIPGEVFRNQQALATRTAWKVTISVISIVTVFFLSWAPIFMTLLEKSFDINSAYMSIMIENPIFTAISFWLVVNSSACNPCLYFLFIESFRQGLIFFCSNCRPPRLRMCRFGRNYEAGEVIRNRHEGRAFELRKLHNTP